MNNDKRLFLLDAYALIYRAFFAFGNRPLINSKGMNVSATTGFTNTLYDLLSSEKCTHIAVVFDPPGGSFRRTEYPQYKAQREEMPEGIRSAIPYIKNIIEAFNIPILEVPNYEADDVIGTLAKKAEKDGYTVYMVTSDKDYGQLVSENIFMHKPAYRGKPVQILGVNDICKLWRIKRPEQLIDILGLMGDASDNIPGVKGIGEKTAIKLIQDYGSIENLLQNVGQIKGANQKKLMEGKENALISKRLATIVLDVPLEYKPEQFDIEEPDRERLAELFSELEFRSIGKRVLGDDFNVNTGGADTGANPPDAGGQLNLFGDSDGDGNAPASPLGAAAPSGKTLESVEHEYHLADTPEKQQELLKQLLQQEAVCFDTETTGIDANVAELVGMSFASKIGEAWYVPLPANPAEMRETLERFKPFFENEKIAKIGQNIKYDLLVLKWHGIEVRGKMHDTMLAHYILEPDLRHNMNFLSESYLGYTPVPIENLIGPKGKTQISMRHVPVQKVAEYAAEDADITLQLHRHFAPDLEKSPKLAQVYSKIETPLVPVLAQMEYNGVAIDVPFLKAYSEELAAETLQLRDTVYELAGMEFNLNSPLQLGKVLFDHMKIPYKGKKTATGQYSTNEATLLKLAPNQPIVQNLLEYRQLTKLRSTYVDALPDLINPKSGRIHSSFNQAVAATGRLSSADPNLQNIPIRTERGREVRKAFVPRNGDHILLAADYSQVELRLMAALSGDEAMQQAFRDGLDIHAATAARVYGVALPDVEPEMRRKAKMVNFGIIYGITAFGLAQRLGASRTEAASIIDEYFNSYPKVKDYMEQSVENARETGYAETIMGRRRKLPDIHSANRTIRQFAERNAINTPIQGSAADMIKLAMIDVHNEMKRRKLQSKMIMQVHDELVFDVYKPELEELTALVKDKMSTAIDDLPVPIVVDAGVGGDWLEAH